MDLRRGGMFAVGALCLISSEACGGSTKQPGALGNMMEGTEGQAGSNSPGSGATMMAGTGSSNGGTTSAGSGGSTSSTPPTGGFSLSGQIYDPQSGNELPGVSVCLLQSPSSCVTTAADGSFTIAGLQANNSGIMATLANYSPGIWPVSPMSNLSTWSLNLRSTMRMAALAQDANATFGNSGAVYFIVNDSQGNALPGVTVSASGGVTSYFPGDGSGKLSSALAATTSAGNGYIFNLASGMAGLAFMGNGLTCARSGAEGWPPSGPAQTVEVPVQSGAVSAAWVVCQ